MLFKYSINSLFVQLCEIDLKILGAKKSMYTKFEYNFMKVKSDVIRLKVLKEYKKNKSMMILLHRR